MRRTWLQIGSCGVLSLAFWAGTALADSTHHSQHKTQPESTGASSSSSGLASQISFEWVKKPTFPLKKPVKIAFKMKQGQENLSDDKLAITHEKLLHMIVFDEQLTHLQHVHPIYNSAKKEWSTELHFMKEGPHRIWAQSQLKDSPVEILLGERVQVGTGRGKTSSPPSIVPQLSDTVGDILVSASFTVTQAGRGTEGRLSFSSVSGKPLKMGKYLGAPAHIIVVPETADSILHVHPLEGSDSDKMTFHTNFPTPGSYRIWVEFKEGGVVKRASMGVAVTAN